MKKNKLWPDAIGAKQILPLAVVVALSVGLVTGWMLSSKHSGGGSDMASHSHGDTTVKNDTMWTCSMHPQIRRHEPGLCPLCGMDLIPVTTDGPTSGPDTVTMSARAKVLARIETTPVQRHQMTDTALRLLGRIEPNETAVKDVTAWIGGRIDRLHVKATGQQVRRGQVIATLYSPEIFSAHQDLLVAQKQLVKLKDSSPAARNAAARALEASQTRLRLLGVQENVLDDLAKMDKPTTRVAIRSPFAGTVTERVATEGAYVTTGALLYKIVNLSNVWVQLDAYEADLSGLTPGQSVAIHVEGVPDTVFNGNITFIDPTLDAQRRVARVRVEVPNGDGALRPGMFVEADIHSAADASGLPPLVIPDTAPLFTGHRAVVFVEDTTADRPTYRARTVRLGVKTGHVYPIIAGLAEGEQVVTKGAFTLDADLQIRGGNSMMTLPDDKSSLVSEAVLSIPAEQRKRFAPALLDYLNIQKELAADQFNEAIHASGDLVKKVSRIKIEGPSAAQTFWRGHRQLIHKTARQLADSASMEAARGSFETLSNQIITLLSRLGNPLDVPVRLTYCPMAFGSKGAYWVQLGETVDNSYYGNAMRTCGEIKETIEPGTYLMNNPKMTTASAIKEK